MSRWTPKRQAKRDRKRREMQLRRAARQQQQQPHTHTFYTASIRPRSEQPTIEARETGPCSSCGLAITLGDGVISHEMPPCQAFLETMSELPAGVIESISVDQLELLPLPQSDGTLN